MRNIVADMLGSGRISEFTYRRKRKPIRYVGDTVMLFRQRSRDCEQNHSDHGERNNKRPEAKLDRPPAIVLIELAPGLRGQIQAGDAGHNDGNERETQLLEGFGSNSSSSNSIFIDCPALIRRIQRAI